MFLSQPSLILCHQWQDHLFTWRGYTQDSLLRPLGFKLNMFLALLGFGSQEVSLLELVSMLFRLRTRIALTPTAKDDVFLERNVVFCFQDATPPCWKDSMSREHLTCTVLQHPPNTLDLLKFTVHRWSDVREHLTSQHNSTSWARKMFRMYL